MPQVSREDVLRAFSEFDDTLRGNKNWHDWERNGNYDYALEHDGHRYPPKMILSLAANVPVSSFSGGIEGANAAFEKLGFVLSKLDKSTPHADTKSAKQVYWVNQGKSYEKERGGGFVWAPNRDKGGAKRSYHRRLQDLQPGDVIVHYADSAIRAISRVLEPAIEAPNPHEKDFEGSGWRVSVEYFDFGERQVTSDRVTESIANLSIEDGPFQTNKGVKLGYLWRFTTEGLARVRSLVGSPWPEWAYVTKDDGAPYSFGAAFQGLVAAIGNTGFVFEPWQVAAYVTALRTKPFTILAGVSGTGKSKLPVLVARATGGIDATIPVRPDWTDSAEVLGYSDLQGTFRPGPLIELARRAMNDPTRHYVCVIDEMNLARVEHYFAEVLSRIESRERQATGGYASPPLLADNVRSSDPEWRDVPLPPNLAIVGTVNMDESAHGFSRKVLDRAFTIELSDVDLGRWHSSAAAVDATPWPASVWFPRAVRLGEAEPLSGEQREVVSLVVDVLGEANQILAHAQLQVGYRTRDEVALFVLAAKDIEDSFVSTRGDKIDPLDLALQMKILPRIAGGSGPIRKVLLGLLGFAMNGRPLDKDQEADELTAKWTADERPAHYAGARFPRCAGRLCLMWERLASDGFTSFWL